MAEVSRFASLPIAREVYNVRALTPVQIVFDQESERVVVGALVNALPPVKHLQQTHHITQERGVLLYVGLVITALLSHLDARRLTKKHPQCRWKRHGSHYLSSIQSKPIKPAAGKCKTAALLALDTLNLKGRSAARTAVEFLHHIFACYAVEMQGDILGQPVFAPLTTR